MQKIIRWAAVGVEGLEQLTLTVDEQGVRARSVAIGGDIEESAIWAVGYEVDCDPAWHTRRVKVWDTASGKQIELFSDGQGQWTGPDGRVLPEFAGCLDVDIRATPFTNTLPIRRLGLTPGRKETIRVLFVPLPELQPEAVDQHYSGLDENLYRYESADREFVRDLVTDSDGLVKEYPGLFKMISTAGDET